MTCGSVVAVVLVLLRCAIGFPYIDNNSADAHRSYTFYTREEWGSASTNVTSFLETPVPYVVIHHTYIPRACYSFEQCSASMRSMQNTHIGLGWGDIGYHFCVGTEGSVYEGRGWDPRGAHATVANRYSVGICLLGDWREELPPTKSLEATKALIEEGINRGTLHPDYRLIGHMQVNNETECPGTALQEHISSWDHFYSGMVDFESF